MAPPLPEVRLLQRDVRGRPPGHPWLFAGEVEPADGSAPEPGAAVRVVDSRGRIAGVGFWNPAGRVRVRWLAEPPDPLPDDEAGVEALIRARLAAAVALRRALGVAEAGRIAFGESDGLPGLVADRYGAVVVAQLVAAGMDRLRPALAAWIADACGVATVFERSESGGREREGLAPARGPLRGTPPPDGLVQRDNWIALAPLAAGRAVLDVCCYTGAFGLALLAAGARSLRGIDASRRAVEVAGRHAALNGLEGRARFERADAGEALAALAAAGERFGFVVLDPSAFARSRAHAALARRAYAALNASALAVVEPGGWLFTCSCTPWVGPRELAAEVSAAARRAGRRAVLVETRGQSRDHPPHPAMPETAYLTGQLWYVES
jgi:23S rRNA (cytosine1962-C5)-methyltransferase